MNAPTNLPAERRQPSEVEVLKGQLTRRADEFKMVLPAHITPEKFQRVIATAAIQNPQLLGCDRQSFLLASMKLAQDGLLPDGREAALVPFKSWNRETRENVWQVQAMPMVYGLRKKILQSGEVLSVETGVVYLADLQSGHFLYEIGMDPPIRYRPNLLLPIEETTDDKIVAAYSIAKIRNESGGDPYWSVEVMRRAEIDKVRQASQTGAVGKKARDGKAIPPKGPWVDWYGEMARKTVLRRHAKVLPMSGDILETFDRDIESERAAESAAAYLSTDAAGPTVLPTADELDAQGGEVIDQETGEVVQRDSRGMSEVDEETARELDAASEQGEGPADSQRGEHFNGSDDGDAIDQLAANQRPSYLAGVQTLRDKLAAAKTVKAVDGIDRDWCAALRGEVEDKDSDLCASIDGEINHRRRELRAQAEGGQ